MKIGRQEHRSSAICASNADTIVVRGRDLCGELIGKVGFTDHVWLLRHGRSCRRAAQRRVLDATLVAIAEHGLVPSVQASRMTLAAAPEALQGAVAAGHPRLRLGGAGLGGSGGPLAARGRHARSQRRPGSRRARGGQRAARGAQAPIPGYGHPLHKGDDPRAARLLEVAAEAAGRRPRTSPPRRWSSALLPELTGKQLAMNVSGAIPAVLLDAGYPVGALKGVPILARTASLIAHLLEEQQRPIGFVLSHAGSSAIAYDGDAPDGFVAGES